MPRILVIEDAPQIRENLEWLLEAAGYDVLSAAAGADGIAQARREHPDLVLCDLMMPEVDGLDVLRTLRAEPATATVPFIFLTARSEREDVRLGMAAGADDYISKPFSSAEVLEAVEARLERQARVEQASEARLDQLRRSIAHALPHELRTPLAAIRGYSQILLTDSDALDGATLREMVAAIHTSSLRLERTIENYDYLVRLDLAVSGDGMPVAATADAAGLVAEAARAVAERHGRLGDLSIEATPGVAPLPGTFLEKAAAELVDNAFKFSSPGAPVAVRCGPDGDGFALEVSDAGRGFRISDARRAGAFLQFERAEHEDGGSGLGLAIVRRIGEVYGGRFGVEAADGGGTTVRLAFSAVEASLSTG